MRSSPVDWRDVPWWFWVITAFQMRGIIIVMFAFQLENSGVLTLLGEGLLQVALSVALGIPALVMAWLFALCTTASRPLQVTLLGMVAASLADLWLQASALLSLLYPEGIWYIHAFTMFLNLLCIVSVVGSPSLRQVFWTRHWREY